MPRLFAPIALLAACGSPDAPAVRALVPEAAVSPAALDFGDAVVPLVHEEAVLVTNAGSAPLEFTAALTAADDRPWSLPVAAGTVAAGESLPVVVRFTPPTFLDFTATLTLTTNDEDTPTLDVPLSGVGVAGPVPDIAVDPPSLDFGTSGVPVVEVLRVRNAGQAPLVLGTIAQTGSGRFAIDPDPSGTTIAPDDLLPVVVTWTPVDAETGDDAVLTLPSNDPDEPEVDVVLVGNGGSDLAWPQADIACPGTTSPPGLLSLDGRGSSDPDGNTPLTYAWTLARLPTDSTGQIVSSAFLTSPTAAVTDLFVDAVGTYEVHLAVTNAIGLTSAPARCVIEALPDEELVVELTWNTPRADLDLHLARNGAALFSSLDDVSYCNRRPSWGSAGSADDPSLALDDRAGFGPEQIQIPAPAAGDYLARVHYFDDNGDGVVTATVRVYVRGTLAFEASRNLSRDQVWDVASVAWPAGTAGALAVEPYPAPRRTCP